MDHRERERYIYTYIICLWLYATFGFQDMDGQHFCNLNFSQGQWNSTINHEISRPSLRPGCQGGDLNFHPTNGMDTTDPCPIPPWWVPHLGSNGKIRKGHIWMVPFHCNEYWEDQGQYQKHTKQMKGRNRKLRNLTHTILHTESNQHTP